MNIYLKIYILIHVICFPLISQEIIDFNIRGKDDGEKSIRQNDYADALIDAKRKALEKVGITIKSYSKVQNSQLFEDLIESKSGGFILPGMKI
jgi:hypothetical protein